ncbi:hypothetical protein FHI69_00175 [Janthinobacterium lividum]|uniref:Uncharacterized protein n=1 Tax=Janthinobacterium lividum TaxID=29581 RepID=A0A5C4NX82_9BURK|nr:hypothetical protein FHI69_00175 [Janthinobacterium lividum]
MRRRFSIHWTRNTRRPPPGRCRSRMTRPRQSRPLPLPRLSTGRGPIPLPACRASNCPPFRTMTAGPLPSTSGVRPLRRHTMKNRPGAPKSWRKPCRNTIAPAR